MGQEEKEAGNLSSVCVLSFVYFVFMVPGLEPTHPTEAQLHPVYLKCFLTKSFKVVERTLEKRKI